MGIFSKKSNDKPGMSPVAGLKNTEIEVTVRRKDGTLKAYRKLKNEKEVECFDV
jgi:hypothetical protein